VSTYLYDAGWRQERERLAGIESLWDPGTVRHLEALGIGGGWTCLEVGAGGGAIVEWLCQRAGRVVATDLDTRFLDAIAAPNLQVRRHDIAADELPDECFDVVHARLVLEHLPGRDSALERMASLVAPDGWLLVEDYDWSSYGVEPPSELGERAAEAVLTFMEDVAGFDRSYGRRLVGELRRVGLRDVGAEGRLRLIDPRSPGADFYRLSLAALRDTLAEQGRLSARDCDAALSLLQAPGSTIISPVMVAAWGRATR
jgi:SAM-dependent methyltransferase